MATQAERKETTTRAVEAAARKLFGTRGFAGTSIDDVAARAGVAKGAVYHHFASKEALFERVLDSIQGELAALPVPPASRKLSDPLDVVADAVLRYLLAASKPEVKRILLVDGPTVIGWQRWREIDDRYFGAMTRAAMAMVLGAGATPREIDAVAHLVLGAVMEAALLCASADDARKTARECASALRRLLEGLRR
jgi:AcrR family transcriptional regulator